MTVLDKITKARSILILDHPFFGSLALRLSLVESDKIETAITNGKELTYNPNFVESLTIEETLGFLAHIVMHAALGHTWRQGNREYIRWNMAGDYAINENLINSDFTLPKGALLSSQYNSLPAEEIYELLQSEKDKEESKGKPEKAKSPTKSKPKKKSKNKNKDDEENKNTDPGKCGAVKPPKTKEEAKELKAEWQAAVAQAVQLSKGELPAGIKRQTDEILNPILPWYVLLRDFVEKSARNDYDWTRPSRRYIGRDIILPSLVSESLPEIVIAIDTSGSISQRQLSQFAIETSNVLGSYDTTIRVIYCDSQVKKEEIFTRADLPMKLKPVGGGGTRFQPVFEYIKEQHITPACLIYFTDLYGSFPDKEPEYPTMWLTTSKDRRAPFGITIGFKN